MSIINKIKDLLGDRYIENEIILLNNITIDEEVLNQNPHTSSLGEPTMGNKEYQHVTNLDDIIDQMKK